MPKGRPWICMIMFFSDKMKTVLHSKAVSDRVHFPVVANIDIVFISLSSFEPQIKNGMNSISSQESLAGATSRLMPRTANRDGLASTLKTPQMPDRGAFTEWISTPSLEDASPDARLESDIFDASLRAIAQHRRRDNAMPELKLVDFPWNCLRRRRFNWSLILPNGNRTL